jgi:predicted transcriptional regulator
MTAPAPIMPSHLAMVAARKIAALKSAAWLLVEAEGRLVGILDRRALTDSRDDELVSARMTALRVAAGPSTAIARAYDLLVQQRLGWLPVAAGMFVVGAVSRARLEHALAGLSGGAAGVARITA